ncbi:MAG: hypothetical protein GY806_19560, partial [Gammaproteobacteria bacterium]|nr:hypothetical protein [Gammaproteobacteria bacterium]
MMKARLISLALLLASATAIADNHTLPKLELGASLSLLDIPNYRGSLNSTT